MKILSIDIETTGLDPEKSQILEFAVVYEDTELYKERQVNNLPFINVIIAHKYIYGDPYALNLNKEVIEKINIFHQNPSLSSDINCNIIEQNGLIHSFLRFLKLNNIDNIEEKVNIIGKNFGLFDKLFLDRVIYNDRSFMNSFKWSRRLLDPAIIWHDPRVDAHLPDTATCLQRAGLTTEGMHTALEDARNMIKLYRLGKGYSKGIV